MNELHDYVCEKVSKAYPAMRPERYVHRAGDKILLARAVISDPEREYRKQVKECITEGKIFQHQNYSSEAETGVLSEIKGTALACSRTPVSLLWQEVTEPRVL